MNSNQNSSNGIFQDCKDFLKRIFNSMPLFIKCVIVSTISLYLLNLIIPYISYYLADIPYFTIYFIQIWRLVTTSLITTNLLSIIFSIFFWYKDAVKLERNIGTTKYMLIFLMNTICIQIMYCSIMFLLSLIINKSILIMKVHPEGVANEGLFPIIMCELTLLCLSNPDENMKLFFFPCVFKAKYYPLFLFLLFTILSGFRIDFEIICGIAFGFLYHYYLKNKSQISNTFVMKLENSFLLRWMKNKNGFINIGGTTTPELNNNIANVRNVNINVNNTTTSHKGFKAFHGKGISVGSSENNSNTKKDTNSETKETKENKEEVKKNNDYNNVSVTINSEANSSDSRIDLNSSDLRP